MNTRTHRVLIAAVVAVAALALAAQTAQAGVRISVTIGTPAVVVRPAPVVVTTYTTTYTTTYATNTYSTTTYTTSCYRPTTVYAVYAPPVRATYPVAYSAPSRGYATYQPATVYRGGYDRRSHDDYGDYSRGDSRPNRMARH